MAGERGRERVVHFVFLFRETRSEERKKRGIPPSPRDKDLSKDVGGQKKMAAELMETMRKKGTGLSRRMQRTAVFK